MKFSVAIASLAALASADKVPETSPPLQMVAKHQLLTRSMNGTAAEERTVNRGGGSVVYSFYDDADTCRGDAGSGGGYVFGGCISSDGATGIYYSACSESGGKTEMTFTSCSSGDCSSGCTTYPIVTDTCSNGMKTSCSDKADSFTDFSEFTYHYEFFYGQSSCTGSYDMWSAYSYNCNSAYDASCAATSTTNYALQGFCDQK